MKQKSLKIEDLQPGAYLRYIGSGFIGFDKSIREMEFVKRDNRTMFDIWVRYCGLDMTVRIFEVEKLY
jgi:hypothetical protein